MAKEKGRLIVIEGLDGSGKATQAALLTKKLQENGENVQQISFPDYESKSSCLVQMYLGGEIGGLDAINPYAASMFYSSDRYISFETVWKKQYISGYTIIADRYTTSNASHQMAKLSRDKWDDYLDWLYNLEFDRMGLPRPDKTIYLDMPPEASRKLIEKRYEGDSGKQDIHERDLDYLLSCRKAALYAAHKLGWLIIDTCAGSDTPLTIEEIHAKVMQLL